jgi:hypothetical protein
MYMPFRTSGSDADFIREVADRRFGAAKLRHTLEIWKGPLRELIASWGAATLERKLREAGARTANVRYWASDHAIRPRSHDDFQILLVTLGLKDQGPQLMSAADEILGAHIEAGHYIRGLLEAKIKQAGLDHSGGVLRIELEADDGGELAVFRLLRVATEQFRVPESALRQPFPVEDAGWLA